MSGCYWEENHNSKRHHVQGNDVQIKRNNWEKTDIKEETVLSMTVKTQEENFILDMEIIRQRGSIVCKRWFCFTGLYSCREKQYGKATSISVKPGKFTSLCTDQLLAPITLVGVILLYSQGRDFSLNVYLFLPIFWSKAL